ncbi:MAG: Fur family transcriptional regulator [Chitinispirillaceae bacterium]
MEEQVRIGQRRTQQRKAIVDFMGKVSTPLTAEEIHYNLLKGHTNINLSTVYRNLEKMEKAGLVSPVRFTIDNNTRYILSEKSHVHHLVCRCCSRAIPLDFCPLESAMDRLDKSQFIIEGHRFEIFGMCRECFEHEEPEREKP